jgi:hypothetical protein
VLFPAPGRPRIKIRDWLGMILYLSHLLKGRTARFFILHTCVVEKERQEEQEALKGITVLGKG